MKIIIIGGVAGGATTAARIRRVDETAEIVLLEKGKYISYANCGLPYYIGGVIEERDKLFVQTPEAFSTRFRVDVRTENEAIFIDRKRKTVTIRQSSEDTYEESYDKLVISTGASPVRPPLPGIDLSGIFTLRNVTDTDRIKEYIKSHAPRKAVVVGAGFIGLEMAENLHAQGAKVSIVEMGNQVMAPIDFSMASLVHQHLMDKGVNLYLEQAVASFSREGKGLKVTFKNGQSIYHITINNSDQINWSSKTLYTYINKGLLQAKPIDMPRAVRRKPKKKKSINHKVDSKCRQGRNFDDYHAYMAEHPDSIVCQIDTVEGKKGGKCILTLCFVTLKFQFGILREHNDSRSVTQAFQYLYSIMDHNLFHLLFDVILTDNGTEFSNPTAIESLDDNGIHPHVFYCEPNRSDQKGACENDHSNFRRIVPKGTNMDPYTQELIDLIFSHVNSFSRTSLNGHTPYESFRFLYGQDILDLWHIRYIKPNDVILKPFLVNQFFKNEGECHDDVH